jgi:hypothetical protein
MTMGAARRGDAGPLMRPRLFFRQKNKFNATDSSDPSLAFRFPDFGCPTATSFPLGTPFTQRILKSEWRVGRIPLRPTSIPVLDPVHH